jgi:RNA polymerase sigma-70 factor (ECF subfamily)
MTGRADDDARAARRHDADLVARVAAQDAEALAELYDRYSRPVYSYLHRVCGDPQTAEELLQEVFFRVWRQATTFDGSRGAFVSWVMSIAHNLAIDEVRRLRRRPRAGTDDPERVLAQAVDRDPHPDEMAWLGDLRRQMRAAVDQIPAPQRDVIELAYFSGLTQREISQRLGIPMGTVKTRTRLGLLRLRERLDPTFGDLYSPLEPPCE